jgi:uncharacterized repeat protein (TIGR03803 family)
MKTCIKESFAVPVLVAALGSVLTGHAAALPLSTLHSFSNGNDGSVPSGLILSGNSLYGSAAEGGSGGNGTVFKVNTDGSGFSLLHNFTICNTNSAGILTNYDGAYPSGSLVVSNSTLYGTTQAGGTSGNGTVFKLNINGTDFGNLYSFSASTTNSSGSYTNSDGAGPGTLIVSSNTLYGTASEGGSSGSGTVFKVNTDGSGFRTLYDFTSRVVYVDDWSGNTFYTNSDGAWPTALVSSGDTLYGSAAEGGSSGNGTVFKVNTDGTGFTVYPVDGGGRLILSGNTLYGTKSGSLPGNVWGDVFKVNIDGTGLTELFGASFLYVYQGYWDLAWVAWGGLLLSGNTLYCTMWHMEPTTEPSASTLLAINTDGSGVATPYEFCKGWGLASCVWLKGGLALSDNTLYGITDDTISSLSFQPDLTVNPSRSNITLSWPTAYAGFDYTGYRLQSTTNLISPFWTTNLPAPVFINGQNTVTNPISGTLQFFRLSQ